MVIAGFVLAILSFLLGAIPFLGWILLILATVFTLISVKKTDNKSLSISSIVLIVVTWVYKIFILVSLGALISSSSSDIKINGENVELSENVTVVEDAADETKPEELEVKKLNEAVAVGDFEYTVTKMETLTSLGNEYVSKDVSDGGVFVAIQYTIKNTGKEPAHFLSYPSTNLMDSEGTIYSSDVEASTNYATQTNIDNSKIISDLNPGISVTETSVYEVAESSFADGEWFFTIDKNAKVKIK